MWICESAAAREARLIASVDSLEKEMFGLQLSHSFDEGELQSLERRMTALADRNLNTREYTSRVVAAELRLRSIKPDYALRSAVARKVDTFARTYTDGDGVAILNRHIDEFVFVVRSRHYFANHIKTLEQRWNADAHLYEEDGVLRFHTGECVKAVQRDSENNPDKVYSLEQEQLRDESDHSALTPSFRVQSDGKYYIGIVTDCSDDQITPNGHAWLRLYNSEGEVFSTGKFPRRKLRAGEALKKVDMKITSSDRHEWLMRKRSDGQSTIAETRMEVTEKEFAELFSSVEEEYRNPDGEFNSSKANCADWVLSKVLDSDLVENVDRSEYAVHFARVVLPKFANDMIDQVKKVTPHVTTRSGQKVSAMPEPTLTYTITNLVAMSVGATNVSRSRAENGGRPLISNFFHVFRRTPVLHPYRLRQLAETLPAQSRGVREAAEEE